MMPMGRAGSACPHYFSTIFCSCPLQLGLDMEELQDIEEDAGLGNGGLGRLAGELATTVPLHQP